MVGYVANYLNPEFYCLLCGWLHTTNLFGHHIISTYCACISNFRDDLVTKSPFLLLVAHTSSILSILGVPLYIFLQSSVITKRTLLLHKYVKYFCVVKFMDANSQKCHIWSFHWPFIQIGKDYRTYQIGNLIYLTCVKVERS